MTNQLTKPYITGKQIKRVAKWLAYYNHREMFDGVVPMRTASLIVESSIDDELRKQARDLLEYIGDYAFRELLKMVGEWLDKLYDEQHRYWNIVKVSIDYIEILKSGKLPNQLAGEK